MAAPAIVKAFVISPIGEPHSELNRHANWVLDRVVRPACERLCTDERRIEPQRSDESSLPGPIMNQVINAIVNDRIVFAVLAGDRPNVYYELAVAIAAGRPVIILRDEKETTHFDVKDFRAINYSYPGHDADAPVEKIQKVADFISSVLAEAPFQPKVFTNLDALAHNYRDYEFRDKFRDIDVAAYCKMFLDATEFIGLQGISLLHFARSDFKWNTPPGYRLPTGKAVAQLNFFDLIRAKIMFDAISVRVMMLHERNEALPHHLKFDNRESFTEALATARDEIRRSYAAWTDLQRELDGRAPERADGRKGRLEVIQLRHGVISHRLSITDQQIVISPYFHIFPFNSQGPTLIVQKGTTFYDCIFREFTDRAVSNEMAIAALQERGSPEVGA